MDKIEKATTADLDHEFRGIGSQIYQRIRQKSEQSSRDNAEEAEQEYISIKVKMMKHESFTLIAVKFTDSSELVRSFQKEM